MNARSTDRLALNRTELAPGRPRLIRWCALVVGALMATACSGTASRVALTPVTPAPTGVHHTGQFVWYDLVTDDPEAAKSFYGDLFGWTFEDVLGDDIVYTVAHQAGVPVGGIAPIEDADVNVSSARWLSMLSVEDVDAATEAVVQAGGTVLLEPRDNVTRGRLALVADPQGAVVAFVRALGGDPPNRDASDLVNGAWMWTELWARDANAAIGFYGSLVGYETETTDLAESADYRVFTRDGRPRAGVNQLPWAEVQPNWLPYIKVQDPAAVARRAEQLGGTVLIPPLPEVRNGSFGVITDPTGAAFAIQRWPINSSGRGDSR
ncbi:MAG: VOC family protein [Longimicrobiales bacterium]